MIKALATDLDGTLFYPKRKLRLMRSKNVRFLKKLISQGKKVILVTGRNRLVSSKVAEKLNTDDITIIGCNGSFVADGKEVFIDNPIDHEDAKILYNLLCEDKEVKTLLIFTDKENMIVQGVHMNFIYQLIGMIGMKAQGVYNERFGYGKKKVLKILDDKDTKIYKIMPWFGLSKKGDELARLASLRYQKSVGDKFEIAWSKDAVEFVKKGVNKAVVLKEVLNHYHIKEDEVMVVGDSGNDVPLFINFPNSFVMKQAPEEVKEKAKYVVESVADLEAYCK